MNKKLFYLIKNKQMTNPGLFKDIIFRPHNLCMGEENYHVVFSQILPNLHPFQIVEILVTMAQLVVAPVYQAVDSGFESRLRLNFLRRPKISRFMLWTCFVRNGDIKVTCLLISPLSTVASLSHCQTPVQNTQANTS